MVFLFCILLHDDLSCILIFESSTPRVVVWHPTSHNRKKIARFLIAFFGSYNFVFGFNVYGIFIIDFYIFLVSYDKYIKKHV